MTRRATRAGGLRAALLVGGAGLLATAAVAAVADARLGQGLAAPVMILLAAAALGLGGLVAAATLLGEHFADLDRLHGVIVLGGAGHPVQPQGEPGAEVARLYAALDRALASVGDNGGGAAERARLAATLAAVGEAIIVLTEDGLISLVNAGGRRLLGERPATVGTSAFDAIDRHALSHALEAARGGHTRQTLRFLDGRDLVARVMPLAAGEGAVLAFAADAPEVGEVQHDLALHDRPPAAPAPDDATPLAALPAVALDTETTGLQVASDRVVSVGAVRLHGRRIYPAASLDLLANPGVPIPRAASAIHGITDRMVRDAPAFADHYPRLLPFLRDVVWVGHNIGFDAAILAGECARAGLPWTPAPLLDTLLLFGALRPDVTDLNLESVARQLGVEPRGRHTALGDALVAAEVFQRLIPLLDAAGCQTLGAARALGATRKDLLARQRAAGW